jgi:hypothetical protein
VSAAMWSAIAASAAAISSLLTYFVHRRNMLDAARPELLLDDWALEPTERGSAYVTFGSIRNVGKGAALHTMVTGPAPGDRPGALVGLENVAIIPPGEAVATNGRVVLFWKNVAPSPSGRLLPITIKVFSWDARSIRHETEYRLVAMDPPDSIAGAMQLAPGLHLLHRTSKPTPVWKLKSGRRLQQLLRAGRRLLTFGSKTRSTKPDRLAKEIEG